MLTSSKLMMSSCQNFLLEFSQAISQYYIPSKFNKCSIARTKNRQGDENPPRPEEPQKAQAK